MSIDATTMGIVKKMIAKNGGSVPEGAVDEAVEKYFSANPEKMMVTQLSPDTTAEDILNLEEGLYYFSGGINICSENEKNIPSEIFLTGLFMYYPEPSEGFYSTYSDSIPFPVIITQHEFLYGLTIPSSADAQSVRGAVPSLYCSTNGFCADNLFNYIEAIYNKVSLLRFKIISQTDYTFELEDTFSDIASAIENKLSSINGYDEKYGAIASLYNDDIYYMSYFNNDPGDEKIVFSGTGDGRSYHVYTMYPGRNTLDTFDLSKLTNQTDATPAYIDIQSESDDTFTLSEDVDTEYLEDAMFYEYDNITTYGLVGDLKPCRQVFLTGTDELGRKTYYALTGTEDDENGCLHMRFSGIDPNGNYKVYSIAESAEDGSLINTVKSYSLTEVQ